MTATATGRRAETVVAAYLQRQGCQIVAQNWRTPRCEIDIVALRNGVAYCCEVKYRRTTRQGSGLEYITPKKLQQMRFAAKNWAYETSWHGAVQLCAIEVSGSDFQITAVVKEL